MQCDPLPEKEGGGRVPARTPASAGGDVADPPLALFQQRLNSTGTGRSRQGLDSPGWRVLAS